MTPDQWDGLRERAEALTFEADDLEAIRALRDFKDYYDTVKVDELTIDGVLALGDQLVAVIDGMFGAGTVQVLFDGDRVKLSGLMVAFEALGKRVSASVAEMTDATEDFTATVPEE